MWDIPRRGADITGNNHIWSSSPRLSENVNKNEACLATGNRCFRVKYTDYCKC